MMDAIFYREGYFDNVAWHTLNPPGTNYSQKGAHDMIRENVDFVSEEHPAEGFLNGYCLADIYQDKAEVFSYLFVPGYYRKALDWLQSDRYLANKFAFMKDALSKISAGFSADFFSELLAR